MFRKVIRVYVHIHGSFKKSDDVLKCVTQTRFLRKKVYLFVLITFLHGCISVVDNKKKKSDKIYVSVFVCLEKGVYECYCSLVSE